MLTPTKSIPLHAGDDKCPVYQPLLKKRRCHYRSTIRTATSSHAQGPHVNLPTSNDTRTVHDERTHALRDSPRASGVADSRSAGPTSAPVIHALPPHGTQRNLGSQTLISPPPEHSRRVDLNTTVLSRDYFLLFFTHTHNNNIHQPLINTINIFSPHSTGKIHMLMLGNQVDYRRVSSFPIKST